MRTLKYRKPPYSLMECEILTKAKNREEFVKCWEEEFDVLAMLSESLPTGPTGKNPALEYLNKLRELRLKYIALAANDTYGLVDQDPDANERFIQESQESIYWNEPHATTKLLKRYGPTEDQEHEKPKRFDWPHKKHVKPMRLEMHKAPRSPDLTAEAAQA